VLAHIRKQPQLLSKPLLTKWFAYGSAVPDGARRNRPRRQGRGGDDFRRRRPFDRCQTITSAVLGSWKELRRALHAIIMVVPVCLEVSQVVYGWELRLSAEWTVPTSPAGMHTHARTTCTGGCWNKTSATTSLQWLRRSTYCRVLISTAGQTITSRSYSRIHRNVVGPVFY
jgi:hypothetical protein